ncbi:LacI family transcriptional regulator [Agreia sp. Leaf244]|uniref:LacI family DNA-binding transcriptional regulator n=1 Tax=Agreia sp. Leaf244 TaxID=1736305 RepID=UPI0006FF0765|nr:LacI family DNA-binding transcriptional regulator [Agreia sp. Leaf244]KQO05395.1 LacI family transcriptional regulator [Agreia sp. Leaf244]
MTRRQLTTVTDVARLAGVSPGTVSKALSGQGQLRSATRERVLAAAKELGYRPSQLAKSLQTGRSYMVGVLTTDSIGRFTIPILTGAEDVLEAGQVSMMLCESRGDRVRERHYLQTMLSRRVDGIIVTGRSSDERPSIGDDLPVPVVYALNKSTDPSDISVLHDDRNGAALAIEHLISTGRRRIVLISGPPHHAATTNRHSGTIEALHRAGLHLAADPVFGPWSEEWGREAAAWLVRAGVEFDGAFCMSDQIARGFSDGLRELGLRVPNDVGIVGMDNWDAMVGASRPPLTTIDLQMSRLGYVAASLMLAQIDGEDIEGGSRLVPSILVMRESTRVATA